MELLYRVHWAIQRADRGDSRVPVEWEVLDGNGKLERVEFIAAIGPGDEGEPVMTLMFPEDD
jgi:hypothetical protein